MADKRFIGDRIMNESTFNELTLYEIMAEDHNIYATLTSDKQVLVEVGKDKKNYNDYAETSHIYAWESLVYFARQVIDADKRIQEEINNKE